MLIYILPYIIYWIRLVAVDAKLQDNGIYYRNCNLVEKF